MQTSKSLDCGHTANKWQDQNYKNQKIDAMWGKHEGEHRIQQMVCKRISGKIRDMEPQCQGHLWKVSVGHKVSCSCWARNQFRLDQLWICKWVTVTSVGDENELRENESGYENRYDLTSCSSDYKMFIYFSLLDTDTNWNCEFILSR